MTTLIGDITLMRGDCMKRMGEIADCSVSAAIIDPPYGTTASKWDKVLPLDRLWECLDRVVKPNGVVCMFGSEPFSTRLRMSNLKHFKYDWIWRKPTCTGFQHAKNMPLKDYEIISVFSNGGMGHKPLLGDRRMAYNPQGIVRVDKMLRKTKNQWGSIAGERKSQKPTFLREFENYPRMVLEYGVDRGIGHPNAKPVALLEYLIRTYTDEGDVVLDCTMGSGSTLVACVNTMRRGIGIELDEKYYELACRRVRNALGEPKLDLV